MDFISAKDASEFWGISQRRVAVLCAEDRIDGAKLVGNMWLIPISASKPVDGRSVRFQPKTPAPVKPFLKWVGGKAQILNKIKMKYPSELGKTIVKYAEPFVGGGAVLFDILSSYNLKEVYISDINRELIHTYLTVRDNVRELISQLQNLEHKHEEFQQEQK